MNRIRNWPAGISTLTQSYVICNQYESFQKFRGITAQKVKFPLGISPVNATKSEGNCGFGQIYLRNPYWKTSFFVQCL